MALLRDKDYLEGDTKDEQNDNETKIPIEELILKTSRSFAPIIIPLVDALGKLSEENLNQTEDMETDGYYVSMVSQYGNEETIRRSVEEQEIKRDYRQIHDDEQLKLF